MDVRWDGATMSVDDMVNEGVRRAYNHPGQRAARVDRRRPGVRAQEHPGQHAGGDPHARSCPATRSRCRSRPRAAARRTRPSSRCSIRPTRIVDWVLKTVPTMGAGWCPPGMLGIGIGGTAEKAMLMAKEVADGAIDMHELKARGPKNRIEELRLELYDKVNALGIGAQGLGGLTTVLDVKIMDYPTHAASKPVAMIPNCAATRHAHFVLDGTGPAKLPSADAGRLAGRALAAGHRTATPRESRHADPEEVAALEAGRDAAADRQDADRPRRRAQAHRGHAGQAARSLPGRFHQPLDLLRRAGRSGARRSGRTRPARPPPRAWTSSPR